MYLIVPLGCPAIPLQVEFLQTGLLILASKYRIDGSGTECLDIVTGKAEVFCCKPVLLR